MTEWRRSIAFAKPWLDEQEAAAAGRAILSGWVTQGPEVAAFEREFAACVGSDHACAVSSGTAALHLALRAAGVTRGDEVITVSHTYIATANSVRYCQATPVFVDIEPATFNINPALIEEALSERTRAILCVHQMGMPCDLQAILEIAHRHHLPVVEDAACALGSEIFCHDQWQRIGRPHGDIACFSFHPRKLITTGDGGMITTARADWDEQFRLWRHHGMSTDDRARHEADRVIFESYPVLGYNYRLTDVQGAIGRRQLQRLPEMVARRRALAEQYAELLADIPDLSVPREPPHARSNWQSYCVRLPGGCDQRRVMQFMLDRGIATRRGVMCVHRQPPYAADHQHVFLPESERAQDESIILPMHHQLTTEDQRYVAQTLREACQTQTTTRKPSPCSI